MDYEKKMFKATCSNCGNKCEVPFKPTGSKPVLCSDCFGNKGNSNRGRGDRGNRFSDRGRGGDRQMHQAICDDCGDSCEVPFRPSGDKPIYCNNCFGKHNDRGGRRDGGRGGNRDNRGGGDINKVAQQINALSNKIDTVIDLLTSGAAKTTPTKKVAVKAAPKAKATTKKPATKKVAKKATKKPVKKAVKKKK